MNMIDDDHVSRVYFDWCINFRALGNAYKFVKN